MVRSLPPPAPGIARPRGLANNPAMSDQPVDERFQHFLRAAEPFWDDAFSLTRVPLLRKALFYYEELKELQHVPGDLLERDSGSWFVVSVDAPNQAGKHTTVVVRPGGRTGKGPAHANELSSGG